MQKTKKSLDAFNKLKDQISLILKDDDAAWDHYRNNGIPKISTQHFSVDQENGERVISNCFNIVLKYRGRGNRVNSFVLNESIANLINEELVNGYICSDNEKNISGFFYSGADIYHYEKVINKIAEFLGVKKGSMLYYDIFK